MERKFLHCTIVLLCVFAFHWRAFSPATMEYFGTFHDMPDIRAGYDSVPDVWSAVVKFSTSAWINTGAPGFRPLSSMLHYGQLVAIDAGYLHVVTVTTLLMFAGVCILAGALVSRWSNYNAGLLAAILCAAVPANWGIPGVDQFGVFWVTDNLLCLLGLLSSLIAFDTWLQSGDRRQAILSLGLMLLACVSKEYAYITPMMFAALYYRRSNGAEPLRGAEPLPGSWPIVTALAMVAVLVLYRRAILPASHHGSSTLLTQNNWWLHSGFTATYWAGGVANGIVLMVDQWQRVLISSLPLAPVLMALRFIYQLRRSLKISASELLLFLSFAPVIGFGLFNHRLMYPWTFASIAATPMFFTFGRHMASTRRFA